MYHQLNRATGRLIAATNLQSPLFPLAPIALQRAEPVNIQYTSAQLSTVTKAPAEAKRNLMPGTNIPYPPVPEHIRAKQALFQKDDDVPVFLKGGASDQILYRLTMALCIVGLIGVADVIYGHSFPKKG